MPINDDKTRCPWCLSDDLYVQYHDEEWGIPEHDDQKLFEMLLLEGAQAGLSWITVLKKRAHYRLLFDQFDAEKMARYDDAKVESLVQDARIIRSRAKIEAFILNAQIFLDICEEESSFDAYIWSFVDHRVIQNQYRKLEEVPAYTEQSQKMSKALKKKGFKFVGPTICYAFMQATGMANDHLVDCWCYDR